MSRPPHHSQLSRLRRIHGQIGGIMRMIEDERYCVDILTQTRAAQAALRRVEEAILRQHVEGCVADAVAAGDDEEIEQKLDELFTAFTTFGRR